MKEGTLTILIVLGALAVGAYFIYTKFFKGIKDVIDNPPVPIPDVNKPPQENPLPYIIGPLGWLIPDIKLPTIIMPDITLPNMALPPNITLTAPPAIPPVSVIPNVIDIALKAPSLLLGGGTKTPEKTFSGKKQTLPALPVSPKNITPSIAISTFSKAITSSKTSTERAKGIAVSLGMIKTALGNVQTSKTYHNR